MKNYGKLNGPQTGDLQQQNTPVTLTEIGFCGADERGAHVPVISDETYGDAITKYCAEKGISYTVFGIRSAMGAHAYK